MVYFCEICGSGTRTKQGVSSHLAQSAACRDAFNRKYQDRQDIESTPEFSWDPDDLASEIPAFDAPDVPAQSYRTTVEILDEDPLPVCWIEDFPGPAGSILAPCTSTFHNQRERQKEAGHAPWHPFERKEEWELAKWLMTSGVSQTKMNEFLKLDVVRTLILFDYTNH